METTESATPRQNVHFNSDDISCEDQAGNVDDMNVENDENHVVADGDDLLQMPVEQQQQPEMNQLQISEEQDLNHDLIAYDHQDLIGEELLPEPQQLIGESLLPELPQQINDYDMSPIDSIEAVENENLVEMKPLLVHETEVFADDTSPLAAAQEDAIPAKPLMRSRKKPGSESQITTEYEDEINDAYTKRSCLRKNFCGHKDENYHPLDTNDGEQSQVSGGAAAAMGCGRVRRFCHVTSQHYLVRTTVSVMNLLARILLWTSFLAMVIAVVWYSRELKMNGTDPHLIAWFSAGAFVILGFPISMCGIFMHLTNYYQPNVQCYVVRILWMVPIYSIESWLCLRFHNAAIYIETLRDFYESYVLYSFLQFLIEVLGGEEALIMMLKDKSPTRGVHMWGMNWFIKPWLMGQPVSRRDSYTPRKNGGGTHASLLESDHGVSSGSTQMSRPIKRIQWTSPFFVKCKFGVLQYVLLKFVSAIFVMILEIYGLYKEGDFTPRGGYLYICIITNLSQCWALYCLVFFYYATKNELGPIRPVGKFMAVKAVVFFTWWQSLGISMLFQMGLIPHYAAIDDGKEWTSEAVAKGLQDYLICIEMFVAAIVHTFVFPHTDYLEPLQMNPQRMNHMTNRRLGRKGRFAQHRRGDDKSACSKSSGGLDPSESLAHDVELGSVDSGNASHGGGRRTIDFKNDRCSTVEESDHESAASSHGMASPRRQRQGFVRALLDSTLPSDVFGETVGMVKGDFHVEKKTLLHHATTSDEYDLFSKRRRMLSKKTKKNSTANQIPDTITM